VCLEEIHSPVGRTEHWDSFSRAAGFHAECHCRCSDGKAKPSGSVYAFVLRIRRGPEPGSAK